MLFLVVGNGFSMPFFLLVVTADWLLMRWSEDNINKNETGCSYWKCIRSAEEVC